jgi:predicted ATP-grasp superfamily ATP-dependent carboligase
VPSYAVDVESWGRVWSSRYCRECFHWDPLDSSIEQSLERLLVIGRRIGQRTLLVPTFDEAAIFAATYYDRLQECFIYPRQTAGLVRSLVSKKEMYFAARRVGVPVPETSWPQTRDQLVEFADSARFPVTLKAIRGMQLKLKAGVTAFIVGSARELMELYDRYEDPGQPNLMLQEYIPGADSCGWGFNGYFNEKSECVFGGTTRRLHQAPVHVGITSLAVVERNEEVDLAARSFMGALGYRGLVNVGFRYDVRDGQYKVVDVNPRLGA